MTETKKIESFLKNKSFNLTKLNGKYDTKRFIDQKCTPSMVRDICFLIDDYVSNSGNKFFTIKDIWYHPLSTEIFVNHYGKGDPQNKDNEKEYDKVFSEPILQLTVAQILKRFNRAKTRGRPFRYNIKNEKLLKLLAFDHQFVLEFQYHFYKKVVEQTSTKLYKLLNNYIGLEHSMVNRKNIKKEEIKLREEFGKFIKNKTNVNLDYEWKRMYLKFINTFAVKEKVFGRANGTLSKYIPNHEEGVYEMELLDYNRNNWYDEILGKDKKISRSSGAKEYERKLNRQKEFTRETNKAISDIKKWHKKNEFDHGDAHDVHHIFPRSRHLDFAATRENLILLSENQHKEAHSINGNLNYSTINPKYQYKLLIKKASSVKNKSNNYDEAKLLKLIKECYKENDKRHLLKEVKNILNE
jgi:hypothetical protein